MTSLVLGNFPLTGQGGDQLVSKAVSAAIAALFKRTGKVEANVRAEPVSKLMQGSVDGFDFIGNDMLMYNGLRIKSMELYVQAVSIDFGAIFRGKVTLRQPTQASMRVVLTEDDLTTSFNTPFVVSKLQQLNIDGKEILFQNTEMTLNDDNKSIRLKTQARAGTFAPFRDIDLTADVDIQERRKIQFVNVEFSDEDEILANELGEAIIDHVNSLLDLDKFALDGTQLRVDKIRMRNKELVFYGTAKIDRFPEKK
ncbi:MAG: DUF2993 domain-containing protein [Cyanobacteria bacterium J06628_6]